MRGKQGFTLVEMLVVIGILGILMATSFTGMARARVVARISKANTEVRMLIGAVLAYEAATGDEFDTSPLEILGGDLSDVDGVPATREKLKELLGEGKNKVAFLNVQMRGTPPAFRDPWGQPYHVRVLKRGSESDLPTERFWASITFPNRNRVKP